MEKKLSASSVPGKRRKGNAKPISDSEIDFSDIPESTAEELKRAVRVGRPSTGNAKQLIAIRISPGLLERVRKLAAKSHKPYQTLLHELLEDAVDRRAA
jgi:predicted DNA binding CopG/RHH family protein